MGKIRLGVIGTGLAWERLHYPALSMLADKYEITALCNRTKEDALQFAEKISLNAENVYEDYNEMLLRKDIDAVDILVPIEMNYEVSEAVAKAGKNFICEKPLAPDMDQAKKFLELTRKYSLKIMIAENYRYNEEYSIIKNIIDSGKIGQVAYFIRNNVSCFPCEMSKDSYAATEWRQHPDFRGGAFLDSALHDIAALRHIFGEVLCVQAFGKPQKEDYNPYSSVNTNILFKSGINGYYTYFPSGQEPQKPAVGFRIFGTLGEIYLEDKYCGVINVVYNDGRRELVNFTPDSGYRNELLNFYHSFFGNEQIYVTPDMEFGDVKMVFDILDSVEKREIVYVDLEARIDLSKLQFHQDRNNYVQ